MSTEITLVNELMSQLKSCPLGLRLNNPCCLRSSSSRWIGKIGESKGFCEFDTFQNGLRAATIVLCKYLFSYHLFHLWDILLRYAPPSDGNNPDVYFDFMKKRLGFTILSTNITYLGIQLKLLVFYISCMELGKEYEIKSKDLKGFISYFFSVVDSAFDEYLTNVYYPVHGKVKNICV